MEGFKVRSIFIRAGSASETMRFLLSSSDMYDNEICGADCGEDSQNRLIFRVFRLFSAIFWVFRVPLTPSFVGSNPATPAIIDSVEP